MTVIMWHDGRALGLFADSANLWKCRCCRIAVYQEEVPVLLRDPSAILIQLVLKMPSTLARGMMNKKRVTTETHFTGCVCIISDI